MADDPKELQELIEEIGISFEKVGLSPVTGRVFTFLLLSEPPHQDFYSIQESVQASKSSISNVLNFLLDEGYIDYTTFTGDRKRYFRVNPEMWLSKFQSRYTELAPFSLLLKKVMEKREGSNHPDFNSGLQDVLGFIDFLDTEFPNLIEKWKKTKETTKTPSSSS